MSTDWLATSIGAQATLQRGVDITKAEQSEGDVPVISSGGISSYHNKSAAKGPGVVLGRKGVVGSVYYVETDYWPHDTTLWVKDFHGNIPRFVYYFFKWMSPRIATMDVGSANPTLNRNHVHPIEISWPSISEQGAITNILGTLDDKIKLTQRMNETLETMAMTLFKSWFVDFDPVQAKVEGRDTGLPREIADLFPDTFEDSELGKVPKGWRVNSLSDVLSLDKGLSYKGEFLTDFGMPMVNLGCFKGKGRFSEDAIKMYSGDFKERHTVKQYDLVLANTDITQKRDVIGSPALIPPQENDDPLLFTHHVFAMRFHAGKELWKVFVYFLLLQEGFRERAMGFATGTTVLALPRDSVLDSLFAAPPCQLLNVFCSRVMPLIERQWSNERESRALTSIRDTLLPKLLSGEVRVKDYNGFIGKRL